MLPDDSIQSMGGKARDAALSDEQKKEIARKAALARWADRPVKATHKGNFKNDFGIDVECYVLDDAKKTAVISQRGMARAIGLSSGGKESGSRLPKFLATKKIAPLVGTELAEKLKNPLKFQWQTPGHEQPPGTIHGFDVTLLIDVCRVIIQAEANGKLGKRYDNVVNQANVIINASAKAGITGLVYALAGYSPSTQEVIDAFKMYIQEEAKKYEKEFPNELYEQWHRLYKIPVPVIGKPWNFKHLTVKHIYYPLAQSNGKILQLVRALRSKDGDRKKKLFQFLSELGARALRMHLGRVLEMAESSADRSTYERKIMERFGGQQELNFLPPIPVAEPQREPENQIQMFPNS